MFSLTPYVLNVTATNALGTASSLLPFLLENIIKPDPPEDLRVSPVPGEPKKLLLEWSPPGSWPFPEYFPLKYRIRYVRDEDSVTRTVPQKNTAKPRDGCVPCCPPPHPTPSLPWPLNLLCFQIGPYEQTSYTLTGLRPGALHHIQVAAKDFTDYGEFSAWSLPASGTPWTEP
uniref:Epstein-Barr virus induced 3 n=1 Tax=Anas platyrhynchos platyrhynchos TaxID=8840 RepID=A0A493TJV7_ANAPP